MSVAQAVKTSTKEVTRQQSVALMKNLTRAALSEGTYFYYLYSFYNLFMTGSIS